MINLFLQSIDFFNLFIILVLHIAKLLLESVIFCNKHVDGSFQSILS